MFRWFDIKFEDKMRGRSGFLTMFRDVLVS
jgi:hypothetical protein